MAQRLYEGGRVRGRVASSRRNGEVLKEWTQEISFDPRKRPWYQEVEGRTDSAIHWTALRIRVAFASRSCIYQRLLAERYPWNRE